MKKSILVLGVVTLGGYFLWKALKAGAQPPQPPPGTINLLCIIRDAELGQSSMFDGTVVATSAVTGLSWSVEASSVGKASFTGLEEGSEYTITIIGASAIFMNINWWRTYLAYSIVCVPSELPLFETGEHYIQIAIPAEYIYQEGPLA